MARNQQVLVNWSSIVDRSFHLASIRKKTNEIRNFCFLFFYHDLNHLDWLVRAAVNDIVSGWWTTGSELETFQPFDHQATNVIHYQVFEIQFEWAIFDCIEIKKNLTMGFVREE